MLENISMAGVCPLAVSHLFTKAELGEIIEIYQGQAMAEVTQSLRSGG